MKRNKHLKKNKFLSWLDARVLVFIIILVLIVLANVVINIFFEADKDNRIFSIQSYRNYSSYGTDKKIMDCLNKEELDGECQNIFSSIEIEKECSLINQTKSKDKCFYLAGIYGTNAGYCNKILDRTLKENCIMEAIMPNEGNMGVRA